MVHGNKEMLLEAVEILQERFISYSEFLFLFLVKK